jgi:hypothetical protein
MLSSVNRNSTCIIHHIPLFTEIPPRSLGGSASDSLSSTSAPLFGIVSHIPYPKLETLSPALRPHSPPNTGNHLLCIPFLYLFTFRSNTVYLSFGSISCSVGISTFHLSTFFIVCPCLASAALTVATRESTFRKRSRCRYFW